MAIPSEPARRGTDRSSSGEEPASSLLSRLLDDSTALARNEIALAKAEFHSSLEDFQVGLAAIALAGGVLLGGFLALVAAAVGALATWMSWWVAALCVGAILTLLGWGLIHTAKRKFGATGQHLERTQSSLQKDATVVARRT